MFCSQVSHHVKDIFESVLSRQVIQNWSFLRLLLLIIGYRVEDTADDMWQLKDIFFYMICGLKISVPQVTYFDPLIQKYLESSKNPFIESKLKPSHHYLHHYPAVY